ncbi:MAG TPA: thioredoxin family protein [Bacteroidales bacterium]|nr:thioredoxin family protein [Bacteroidales bacterium]HOK98793.1 thioredoxin family protein [Bacteroidales bacterium]HPO64957.1 thioredoxin family protein [Bacteroidales bacterium]
MKKLFVFTFMIFSYLGSSAQVKVGDVAPTFNLKNVDGKMVSLDDYRSQKGVIVIFTCNHCPYAKAYEDRIIALDKQYKPKGFPVVAINPNDVSIVPEDSYENMQVRAKEKGFTFPYLYDATQAVANAYGAERTPHVFLLKKSGDKFEVAYIGAIDDNYKDASAVKTRYVEQAIEAILAGKKPEPSTTKAIGCTVKRK